MYESWRNFCEKVGLDPGLLQAEQDSSVFSDVAELVTDFISQNGINGEAVFVWDTFDNGQFLGSNRFGILINTQSGQLIRYIPRPLDERTEDGADFTTELTLVRKEQGNRQFDRCQPIRHIPAKVGHNMVIER